MIFRFALCVEFFGKTCALLRMDCALCKKQSTQFLCFGGERIRCVHHVSTRSHHDVSVTKSVVPELLNHCIKVLLAVPARVSHARASNPFLPTTRRVVMTSIASRHH